MARSIKKGPYIESSLEKKIETMNSRNEKKIIKTWSRRSTIAPDFIGHTLAVIMGKNLFLFILLKTWWVIN